MLNTKIYKICLLSGFLINALLVAGCGKKGEPLAPEGTTDAFPTTYPTAE